MREPGALVMVTTSFPFANDGSEAAGSFVSDLAEEIATLMPVRIVGPGPQADRAHWGDGVEVFRYAAPPRPLSTMRLRSPSDLAWSWRVMTGGHKATLRAVQAGPTRHILALWALPSGQWARKAAARARIDYSVWTLGSDIWSLGKLPLVRRMLRSVLRGACYRFADGLLLARESEAVCDRPFEFLPSTRRILSQRTQPPRSAAPYRLLFLGRWHPNKGIDLLLDALQSLGEDDWRAISAVEIAGGGPLQDLVLARIADLVASGRPVELRGFLDKAAAEASIARADYLMIPSRVESIPVVFSDAMKLSCPVIASPVGDLPELVRETGVLADAVGAHAFANAIQRALRGSADGFSPATAAMAQRFALPAIARQMHARFVDGA